MSKASPKNPRLPAEFEPQEAIWLSWPSNRESCPKTYDRLQDKFGELASTISRYERVRINAPMLSHMGIRLAVADNEGDLSQVDIYEHATNDVWCRDHGPIFIKDKTNGALSITDWKFNGWGEQFPPYDLDNQIPERAADKKRNPKMTKAAAEKEFKRMFGIESVFWLDKGISGDDTGGHIDDMVRFIREDAVICMVEPKDSDPNHKVLKKVREQLDDLRTADGSKVEIIEVEMPNAVEAKNWRLDRLPASYANFLILNNAIIIPIFGQKKKDALAEDIISENFPGREMISMTAKDLLMEGGAIHCVAMHEPKAG